MAWKLFADISVLVGESFWRGPSALDGSVAIENLSPGAWPVINTEVATSLGLPRARPGTVIIYPVGTSGARSHQFISIESENAVTREFFQHRIGGVMTDWAEPYAYWNPTPMTVDTVLNQLPTGEHLVPNVVVARALNLPRERPGIFGTYVIGAGRIQSFVSIEDGVQAPIKYKRGVTLAGVAQPWEIDGGSGGGSVSGDDSGTVRRSLLKQALTARKGGRIGTSGKGVVALRFDDAPADFVSKVLPLLASRGLPFTRVTTSQTISAEAIPAAAFPEMQTYSIQHGGEVWNHGATHTNSSGAGAIYADFVGALTDLRTLMPRIPIDCFAPPGGSVSYDGHMPSNTISNWADTYAGRLLLGHHAIASGYSQDSYYRPLDGQLRDGQIHYSVDAYDLARAKELIDRARDWKTGVVLMWHANSLGESGNMTVSEFSAVLDYLVAQRDAGNVVVLTKSGLGVADVGSTYRDNALTRSSGNPFSETIQFPQYRQNLPGSTRELTATVTAAAGTKVTSTVGESAKIHTVPSGGTLNLRHCATVPLDVTALTVSINASTSGARMYAI